MTWLWQIALKKAAGAAVVAGISLLSSPKVVEVLNYLAQNGVHVDVRIDEKVATVSMFALLTFLGNWAKHNLK